MAHDPVVEGPGFDFALGTRVVYGPGSLARLGELAAGLGAKSALVVTDAGLVAAGHAARAEQSLAARGLAVRTYDRVRENPTTEDVDECLAFARESPPDLLVGIGGGSSLDTAKGTNFLFTNGGRMEDYWGVGKAAHPMLPLIAVPTTAGTGSELQSFALISRASDHRKMACGDPKAAARVALLDPELTLTMPRAVAACTGLDTFAHAVETAVTTRRTPLSGVFSRESFRLANASFERVLSDPRDLEARGSMLLAAAWGGLAIEASMLGAAHSLANPLTSRYHVVHGHAVGLMLPHVVRFNAREPAAAREYVALARAAGLSGPDTPADVACETLAARLAELLAASGLATGLGALGVGTDAVDTLARESAEQWTAQFNPRAVGAAELAGIYAAAR